MLSKAVFRTGLISHRPFRISIRLQSTKESVEHNVEPSFEDSNLGSSEPNPLTENQIQALGDLFEAQSSFSVFPRIEDVKPEELVGSTTFGKRTYFVERTSKGNLPVYTDMKNSNKIVTEVRRIRGDPVQLRNDLQERLPFIPKKFWKVHMQSKKIVIEGDATKYVKNILSSTF